MNEIKLSVDDKNLDTVLNILKNLKAGLISEIQTNGKLSSKPNSTRYQPKTNTIVREEDSGTNDTSGKYINASAYKQRLNNKSR